MSQTVAVFGASGRIGQAQVRQLLAAGYTPIAVTRHPDTLAQAGLGGVAAVRADFVDRDSLAAAVEAVDAVFFQLPTMASPVDARGYAQNFADAISVAGKRVIMNTTMWAPDGAPVGVAMYDFAREAEDILADAGLQLVIFRPTVMMESLLTVLWKPSIINEGVARYAQRPGLCANWICTDDIARFMIEGLRRPDLTGRRIRIGGSEKLAVEQAVQIVAEAIGRPVRYEYMPPDRYGRYLYRVLAELAGPGLLGSTEDHYAAFWERFYGFNNDSPLRPLEVDVEELFAEIPITCTPMRDWAARQRWHAEETSMVSVLG
jgi:uncharacterized protein YbjT (DUF2867 family)